MKAFDAYLTVVMPDTTRMAIDKVVGDTTPHALLKLVQDSLRYAASPSEVLGAIARGFTQLHVAPEGDLEGALEMGVYLNEAAKINLAHSADGITLYCSLSVEEFASIPRDKLWGRIRPKLRPRLFREAEENLLDAIFGSDVNEQPNPHLGPPGVN